jgi:mono/diheme cytochrome c family protein
MQRTLRIGFAVLALAAAQAAAAQDQALIQGGAQVYQTNCEECHGEGLINPGGTFDLRSLGADERARFDRSVTEGKGQMPAWGGQLGAQELDQLWAYIRSRADR